MEKQTPQENFIDSVRQAEEHVQKYEQTRDEKDLREAAAYLCAAICKKREAMIEFREQIPLMAKDFINNERSQIEALEKKFQIPRDLEIKINQYLDKF